MDKKDANLVNAKILMERINKLKSRKENSKLNQSGRVEQKINDIYAKINLILCDLEVIQLVSF